MGLFLPLSKTIECAAAIVKLNKEKIGRIRKEGKECKDKGIEISTPNKVTRPPANKVDDMGKCIIRREVHKYYSLYKETPTLGKLHKFCKRDIGFKVCKETLRKLILSMGFAFKKCKDKRKYLVERSDIVARYLPGRNMVPYPLHCPQVLARCKLAAQSASVLALPVVEDRSSSLEAHIPPVSILPWTRYLCVKVAPNVSRLHVQYYQRSSTVASRMTFLGACPHGELLRNSRHHKIRSLLASALRGKNYQVEEEVHGLSTNGSTRRIDIIAIPTRSTSGFIIDQIVRMEMYENKPAEVEKLLSSNLLSKKPKVRIYKTIILPIVLYGCETWTLTLREEQRLRMFENKVLRKIFGAKRNEVTGEWRKLHNAKLHALYSSPNIMRNIKSRNLRWTGHVAHQVSKFRNQFHKLSLPPCPVPTRWGSWLEACNYYARHLQSVKKVVQSFDTDDAAAIQIRQELLNDETIEKEVTDIKSNFGYLPDAIIQLGKSGVELVEQINIMRTIVNKLSAVEGEIGKRVGEKMNKVLIKNDGYDILSRISDVLTKTFPNDVIQHTHETHLNDILNTQLNSKHIHSLTLHYERTLTGNKRRQDQQRPVLKMAQNRSKHVNKMTDDDDYDDDDDDDDDNDDDDDDEYRLSGLTLSHKGHKITIKTAIVYRVLKSIQYFRRC
ncbi:hypothetical protein ANN_23073 [Periplaneta americana]|uniref:Uncharacterized protein n=1 Tax=Periplaneta americana TaxID=6978 RepID=A0ABQ8SLC0_PERAM|nr:hypothetical protein ANN_23073 [Periplaneta americana]